MKRLVSLLAFLLCCIGARAGLPPVPEDTGYRWALLLSADSNDPRAIRNVASLLVSHYGFTRERVLMLDGDRTTLAEINSSMGRIYSQAKGNDTLLVVIDMPVVRDGSSLFALPVGARPDTPWTWLNFSQIRSWLDATHAGRVMLIYTTCPQGARSSFDDPVIGRFIQGKRQGPIDFVRACDPTQMRPSSSGRANDRSPLPSSFVDALAGALMQAVRSGEPRIGGRQLVELMQQRPSMLVEVTRVPEYIEEGYRFIPTRAGQPDLPSPYDRAGDTVSRRQAISALVSASRVDEASERASVAQLRGIALDPGARTGAAPSPSALSLRLQAVQSLASIGTPPALSALAAVSSAATDEASVRREAIVQLSRRSSNFAAGTAAVRGGLDDGDPSVREAAARGVVLVKDPLSRDRLAALAQSTSEPAAVRTAAIQALGAIQPERNQQALLALTRDSDPAIRLEAITALGSTPPSALTTGALLERLGRDDDMAVRRAAASAVSRTMTPSDIGRVGPALTAVMAQGPDPVRQGAAYSLGQIGGARAVAALEAAARNADFSVDARIAALEALGEAAAGMDPSTRESVTSTLEGAARDDDAGVRRAVATALGKLGTPRSTAVALRLVEDPDTFVRRAAQAATVGVPVSELAGKLRSGSPEARLQAVRLLGQRPPVEAAEPLAAALGDESPLVRDAAVSALARYRDPAATATVAKLLDGDNPRTRAAAASVLGLNCDMGGLKPLLASVKGDGKTVATELMPALGMCRLPEARDVVLGASKDPNPAVRWVAVDALGRQPDQPAAVNRLREMSQQDESAEIRAAAAETLKPLASLWDSYVEEVAVDLVNDEHKGIRPNVRRFSQTYPAKPGYRIVSYTLTESSASRVKSKSVQVESDGKQITLHADLEAGPIFDQYRGWLKARLQITQVRRDVLVP